MQGEQRCAGTSNAACSPEAAVAEPQADVLSLWEWAVGTGWAESEGPAG